jgi:uncharacterized protein YndB with AHSA1/START domain
MTELRLGEALHKSIRVACSPAHAFRVFTGDINMWWPSSHRKWQDSELHFESGKGGRFYERAPGGEERPLGEVVHWEPPTRVHYSWYPGGGVGATEVEVQFVLEGQGTLVQVTHREAESQLGPQWPKRASHFSKAWDDVLPAFSQWIERK